MGNRYSVAFLLSTFPDHFSREQGPKPPWLAPLHSLNLQHLFIGPKSRQVAHIIYYIISNTITPIREPFLHIRPLNSLDLDKGYSPPYSSSHNKPTSHPLPSPADSKPATCPPSPSPLSTHTAALYYSTSIHSA